MEQGIIKADDLEAITDELGVNMPAEKMVIQASIVRDNVYLAATRASELLLSVSNDLLSALNGEYFEEEIETFTHRPAVLRAGRKVVEIDAKIKEETEDGYKDGFLVKVCPSKNRIKINIQNQVSQVKLDLYGTSKMISLPLYCAAGAAILGPAGVIIGFTAALASVIIPFFKPPELLKDYNNKNLFRNYARLAAEISPEDAKSFFDDYVALPATVYGAIENVISRNKLLAQDLDAKHSELRLLEEKLR